MSWDLTPEKRAAIHEALQASLDEGEVAVKWVAVIEVSYTENGGGRFIQHRAGTLQPDDMPYVWDVMGLLRASEVVAEAQMLEQTRPAEDLDEDDE